MIIEYLIVLIGILSFIFSILILCKKNTKLINIIFIVCFILLIFLVILYNYNYYSELDYHVGKDTKNYYGNGRFQTMKTPYNNNGKIISIITLDDKKTKTSILTFVNYEKKVGDKVYFIASEGYLVLDYKEETYQLSKNLYDFPEKEQKIFEEMLQ